MRNDKLQSALIAFLLAFMMSLGCIGAIVTGLDMTVNLWMVALWCGISALVSAILFTLSLHPLPFCAAAATGGILWFAGMELSFWAVVFRFSKVYNNAFGWGVLRPEHYTAEMLEPELWLFLCFYGAVLAMVFAWGLCHKKFSLPGIFFGVFTLGSCFLTKETVPDRIWLWLFLFGFLMLLLTRGIGGKNPVQSNRLTRMAALPLAALLLLLFALTPQSTYNADKPAKSVLNTVLENRVFQAIFGDLTESNNGISVDTDRVNLSKQGPRNPGQDLVLQVTTDFDGTIYLRSRALSRYDGETWYMNQEDDVSEDTTWPDYDKMETLGTVQITTRFAHNLLYQPYYVQQMEGHSLGKELENKDKLTEYSYTVAKAPGDSQLAAMETAMPFEYTQTTGNYTSWHTKMAKRIVGDKTSVYDQAQAIADYVRKSATYDLQTQAMSRWSTDFVAWFLQDSYTGYCVHFASATAVLLQASGIPARYVNGYLVEVTAGETTPVYTSNAHAWVEYWLPGFGWTVLESTPPATAEPVPAPEPEKDNSALLVIAIAAALTLALTVFIQRKVRLHLRRKKLSAGDLRRQTLAYWQEAVRFANCLEESPGQNLLELAEKAKFSNHPMTPEDLEPFRIYLDSAKQRIRRHGILRKLYYRFVLALY